MPSTTQAIKLFKQHHVILCPGKAANAGLKTDNKKEKDKKPREKETKKIRKIRKKKGVLDVSVYRGLLASSRDKPTNAL